MEAKKILLAPGDGIGPEVAVEAVKVIEAVSKCYGHRFEFDEEHVGGAAIERYGVALRPEGLKRAQASDAVLFGAVGDPRYDDSSQKVRPEQAILDLRGGLKLFANIRPVKIFEALAGESPLKREIVKDVDIVVVRELTGDVYFGKPQRRWVSERGREAVDTMSYTEAEVERIMHVAFRLAQNRGRRVASVDKANVLETSRLWREIAREVASHYPDVELENVLVDACAMHLINRPSRFDVIVTTNMFGDILTDEAAMLTGSLGMMPSASLGERKPDGTGMGLYEPIHGSAPDIAGQGLANPLGMILSVAMMLRHSFGLNKEADSVEKAVASTLEQGFRTKDISRRGGNSVTTGEMGTLVAEGIASMGSNQAVAGYFQEA